MDLFSHEGKDPFYMDVRAEKANWHRAAKQYWQHLYDTYKSYLDFDFPKKFPNEFMNRLWELTILHYLASRNPSIELSIVGGARQASKPDFCITVDKEKFYVEATCVGPGTQQNYPNLNLTLEEVSGIARSVPVGEYRERLTSSFNEKAVKKYQQGYKEHIGDSGLIIAISAAPISFIHQPMSPDIDLSCFFPSSPYISVPFHKDGSGGIPLPGNPYYEIEETFKKTTNGSNIVSNYFSNPDYAYISAVLISHSSLALFPEIDEYKPCSWGITRNDFLLMRNPLATKKLPEGSLSVYRETIATQTTDGYEIKIKETR